MKEFKRGEYIAGGIDKKVYEDSEDPEKIIGLYQMPAESKEFVNAQFYLTKILHLLFPKNIPDIHLMSYDPHVVRKERINHDITHTIIQRSREVDGYMDNMSEDERRKLNEAMQKIYDDPKYKGFVRALRGLGVTIDYNAVNFTYDKEGNIVYFDDIDPKRAFDFGSFDRKKFADAIEKIPGEDKKKALHYFKRLNVLEQRIFKKSASSL